MKTTEIQVIYDFICPWCWIGEKKLKEAIQLASAEEKVTLRFTPFELNPSMPKEGLSRKEYRSAKFGSWAHSQEKDAQVTVAGQQVGLKFNYDRVALTPNTRLAHRVMRFAQRDVEPAKLLALYDAIFTAYFSTGLDIGSLEVLIEIAAQAGLDGEALRAYLDSGAGDEEVAAEEWQIQRQGVRSVPTLRIGRTEVSGAQPAVVIAEEIREALYSEPAGGVTSEVQS